MADDSTATTAPLAPITSIRHIRDDLEDKMPKPYLGRAMVAADIENPNGTPRHGKKGYSVLQQHVSFFDQNKDGIIYPWETYAGMDYIVNIHKGKHGSDTDVYDTEGRFVPVNFENMFSKYARTVPGKMSFRELLDMTEGNRDAFDLVGGIISKAKWGLVYFIAKDDDGFFSKEAMRGMFDGSLFENLAQKE